MLKNKILLAFVAILFGTTIHAQSIAIDDARILGALPAGKSYGSGGTVAVPITLTGCFAKNNVFTWELQNATSSAVVATGSVSVFYATFVNVTIPASLPSGNYKVLVKASTMGAASATSASFPVVNTASPVIAKAIPQNPDYILKDEYYYGICDGSAINSMILRDSSTAGGTDSLEVIDNYRLVPSNAKYTPVAGRFNLLFNPTYTFGKNRDAYYTAFLKTISPTNIVSTKAFHIINNSWDIKTFVEAKSLNYSCAGDTVSLAFVYDYSQVAHIQQNFPGAIININWKDGTPNQDFTQCDILASNGKVKHQYLTGSCLPPNNSTGYDITSTVTNPFNVFNGPGLTGTCAAGTKDITTTSIFTKPTSNIKVDSVVCANDTIKFKNLSIAGQGVANSSGIPVCAQLANYTWVIDKDTTNPLYQTQTGKVEPKKDTAYVFNSNQPGYHTVSLYVNNNYGNYAPCPSHDTTRTFCVDTAKVRPAFQMDSAGTGVYKDSIIGCAPVICLKNITERTFCVDTSQFKYFWRVLDATSPGPNYTEVPVGINYSFTSGGKNSKSPCISINKTGKYLIELMASASCLIDSSLAVRKYVEANGDAGVNFTVGTDTVKYCMQTATDFLTINYNPTAPQNTFLGLYDSVHYTYQSSTAGFLNYLWTVTPGVYGTDYDFAGGITDSSAKYPTIRFKKSGLYKVTVKFSNNCQPKTAIQYVAFREPIVVKAGTNTGLTDSICHTTNTFNITGASASTAFSNGPVGQIFWTSSNGGDGTFNPQSGTPSTPNIFSPVYTPGPNDKAISCATGAIIKLTMSVVGIQPQSCAIAIDQRNLFIRPCVSVNDTAFNSCSGSSVNYAITKAGLVGSTFSWTSAVLAGVVNGNTNNALGSIKINDVLTGNGIVRYTLQPQKDGCVGNPFTVTDTVRPIPAKPTLNLDYPNNATHSMCSGDTAIISLTSPNPTDKFSWTSYTYAGKILGNSTGVNQASPIKDILTNTGAPLLIDSVTYVVKTSSTFGCAGGIADSVTVVVTPGANIAKIFGGSYKYLCNKNCDTIKHNIPGVAGIGTMQLVYNSIAPSPDPTITKLNDSTDLVCGMKPRAFYKFVWKIDPALAGCVTSRDSVTLEVTDTIPTPNAGIDTSICDVNGAIQRTINIRGSVSRPLFPNEYVYYNGAGPSGLTYPFYFTNRGVYAVEMRVKNFVCPDKVDTVLVRAYGKPLGGSITVNPIQSSFCQGSTVTLTANFDTTLGDIGRWYYQIFNPPFTIFAVGQGQNPFTYTANQGAGFNSLILSKGWNFGCRDSIYTSGYNINVDSITIAGGVKASDTIVCVPGTVVVLSDTGRRGSVQGWIRSSTAVGGYGSIFAIGNPVSVAVNATTWYRAIVKNGNCNTDTTAPFRIFVPSGADVAHTGNDTAVCGAVTFNLSGNIPVVGNGFWQLIAGPVQTQATPMGVLALGATPNDTTSQNPVNVHIQEYGTYQFVWKVKNLNCDATADTITIKNTQPLANNAIGTPVDTVCNGTKVTVTGTVPTGGSGTYGYTWDYSTNNGTSWTVGSLASNSYTFTATTDVWVRRVVKSDSCYDYSNIIKFIVHPNILNNVITTGTPATCVNTPAPNITGSLPTGGSGSFTYSWNYGSNLDTSNHLWLDPNISTQSYSPTFNVTDTIHFRRIVVSGKCSDTSAIATVLVYPDAKADFESNIYTKCPTFVLGNHITNNVLPFTSYDWYVTYQGVRTFLGNSAAFPGYSITTGPDSAMITLIATSTHIPVCKTDSMSKMFYTSATPVASFTVSTNLACANNTGTSTTSVVFTNTTVNKSLFQYLWKWGNGGQSAIVDPLAGGQVYPPSTTGADSTVTATLIASSPSCGSSSFTDTIRIRTRPVVNFNLSPTYQCSGGPVSFTNQTVGSPNLTWAWKFGDNIGTSTQSNPTYIYNTSSLTTFNPVLIASNECASDSATNSVVIAANTVSLSITVKGGNKYQCLPDTVTLYSNSNGGTSYFWDFGDGTTSVPTSKGKDTVIHIYTTPGKFIITLTGSTSCGTVTKTDSIFAYGTPIVAYSIAPNTTVCKGDTVRFTNLTDTATNYVWNFGNGTGGGVNPTRTYTTSGIYSVKLTATRIHNLPIGGILPCTDTSSIQTVSVRDTMPGSFTITPLGTSCLPFDVQFSNTTNITTLPISTINWTFGEPVAQSGNPVSHTYNQLGQYNVTLTVVNAGNCTYIDSQKVTVAGPIGTWTHDTGYVCGNTPVRFQINANSTDSVTINYGDVTPVVTVPYASIANPFFHTYAVGGNYIPTVTLKSVNGCTYFIGAMGTIRVDYVKAAYTVNPQVQNCGSTVLSFANTTQIDQTPIAAAYIWNINGVDYFVANPSVTFNTTDVYNVRMQVTSLSGCFDSVATAPIYVKVNNIPNILSITRQDTACAGQTINYTAVLSPSEDPIMNYNWGFGNNTTGSGISSQTIYGNAGVYFDTLTVVTSNGCKSTLVTGPLVINGSPIVSINPSIDSTICLGASLNLSAFSSGTTPIATYSWYPPIGLSATTGANVVATPTNLTKYVVTGTSARGCTDTASINIDVVQPYTVTVVSANTPHDSICIGDKITLYASGATNYLWSPAAGLDTIRGSKVVASPTATTVYTVVGTNPANCFSPSASISVGVGDTTHINLGLDTVYLQGGTYYPLTASVVNGPIATWNWTPADNLSCSDCGNPIATVKSNICYNVEATSIYGCKAQDNICIVAFCEASQVFIPNAFTPDGDGVNDYLWIKARGIKSVKSFRIFNRWGQVVFERANFVPVDYDRINSWDGKFKGVIAPTEVYVYTCEVVCENGTKFTYTGNISLIK